MFPEIFVPAIEHARCQTGSFIVDNPSDAEVPPGADFFTRAVDLALGSQESQAEARNFAIWAIEDLDLRSSFLAALAFELNKLKMDPKTMSDYPLAFGIVCHVLTFEDHIQFDSWLALGNLGPEEMAHVRYYFKAAGMASMAEALERAEKAWTDAGGQDGQACEAAEAEIHAPSNLFADDDERWDYLMDLLANKDLWQAR